MSKVTIIKCSDNEADRLAQQIKNGADEQEYQPFRGPGKVYEFGTLQIDQPKKEVTINGSQVELEPREFEILGLFASHPNEALPCDFLHNVIWPHPDMEHGIEEVIEQVESLKKKLRLEESGANCRFIDENTQRGPGYRFLVSAK
jgi:DNA-binding response OmpR family regulator